MNFFCLAFFITALQINISWWGNYLIKLIGMLFFVLGILEVSCFNSGFRRFKMPAVAVAGLSAVGAVCFAVMSAAGASKNALNIAGIAFGVVVTLSALAFQKPIIRDIAADKELVNDVSLVKRFSKSWDKLAIITLANLVCDIVNRLAAAKVLVDYSGLLMAISKILMYIFALVILFQANKIRVDHNKKHSA
ncbi:MAG: hypothetical protein IJU04_06485 [Ruminococcus sp.]|nr:hypothetical protein [Ruminococcus sp.]